MRLPTGAESREPIFPMLRDRSPVPAATQTKCIHIQMGGGRGKVKQDAW